VPADPLVIVSCGKAKRFTASTAQTLYTGPFVQAGLRWARSVVPVEAIFILSALYGLVHAQEEIEPYERRLGDPGSVTPAVLKQQVLARDLFDRTVYVCAGVDYVRLCRTVWPDAIAPFGVERGHRGQGHMMQAMREQHGQLIKGVPA
jgi:hypothetical protein